MNKIGKVVWLYNESQQSVFKTKYRVIEEKSEEESQDFCKHLIIKDNDGNMKEVREYEVIVALDERGIQHYLSENGVCADVYVRQAGGVNVHIDWGDWKHEHAYTEFLMKLIGFKKIDDIITEEDGSDCYSATHLFVK